MARPPLFRRATVTRIVKETADARTFVLVPHEGPFSYKAGQFCTFRVRADGVELFRSYSMSSAPETDTELMTTVKRVPGGKVSNWLHDNISEGDEVDVTRPAGAFCLNGSSVPFLGFSGGSGITPIVSLAKSALATTDRTVRLLCADRDPASAIFDTALEDLVAQYPDRLSVVRNFDVESGFLDAATIREFIGDDGDADNYLCGPEPFMAVVEAALPGPGLVFSEKFGAATSPVPNPGTAAHPVLDGSVTLTFDDETVTVARHAGETLLESARRGGISPPTGCEAGNCGTCIAKLSAGTAAMRVNDALDDDEVADGYVLTCQAVPTKLPIIVNYDE